MGPAHEHFDATRAFTHIEKLALLRRFPGTPGEREAQEYLKGVGEEIGVPMKEEEFTYSSAPLTVILPGICVVLGLLCVTGSLTYLWGTPLCMIPGAILLLAIYLGFKWSGTFELAGAKGGKSRSVNLLGEIKGTEPQGTVILSAHYDSKSQTMPVVVRAAFYMIGFLFAILLGLALVVLGILSAAGPDYLGSRTGFWVTLIPAFFLVALAFNFTGNRSPGAVDNAAGEAVILESARVLSGEPLKNFDVIVASFGCEEVGLCGSVSYLLAHEVELKERRCYVLNFDIPFSPAGNLYLNTRFELPPTDTSKYLNGLAREAARDMGIEVKGLFLPVGAAADHMPWVKHGFEATGFVSATTYVHRAGDTPEKIDREGLRRVGEVALAVVRRIDQEASPSPACPVNPDTDLR